MSDMEFDVSISSMTNGRYVRFPLWLSRALEAQGFNQVHGTVTDDGILLRPYRTATVKNQRMEPVELPDWSNS